MPTHLPQARDIPEVGSVLNGKWRLDKLIGRGGMSSVFTATHRNGRRGAVKLLHPELGSDETTRKRFLREGHLANRVEHPGVVAILDDDVTDNGMIYLVMELLEGETLDERVQRTGKLNPGAAVQISMELCDVLTAIHAAGIIHRDVKPANVFITNDGRIKVLDFGVARFFEGTGYTKTGDAIGTPAFMAPEQARGERDKVDERSDVWAAGACLFTMLTGRRVHVDTGVQRVLLRAMTLAAPPLASVAPEVSPMLASVIDRALAFEPGQRWPSAMAFRDALGAAASGRSLDSSPIESPPVSSEDEPTEVAKLHGGIESTTSDMMTDKPEPTVDEASVSVSFSDDRAPAVRFADGTATLASAGMTPRGSTPPIAPTVVTSAHAVAAAVQPARVRTAPLAAKLTMRMDEAAPSSDKPTLRIEEDKSLTGTMVMDDTGPVDMKSTVRLSDEEAARMEQEVAHSAYAKIAAARAAVAAHHASGEFQGSGEFPPVHPARAQPPATQPRPSHLPRWPLVLLALLVLAGIAAFTTYRFLRAEPPGKGEGSRAVPVLPLG
jgi:serine/threonine-protein kinase